MSTSVLLVSESNDQHVKIIHERMKARAIQSRCLYMDNLATVMGTWRIASDPKIAFSSSWIKAETNVVWDRRRTTTLEKIDIVQSFVLQETSGLLNAILDAHSSCRWVNRRGSHSSARSKITQLQRARNIGLRIPDTIVTNDISELRYFASLHNGEIIAKPIQTQVLEAPGGELVLGTRKLTPEHFDSAVKFAPCYAQERLKIESEIRVVMFGNEPYGFRLTGNRAADDIKQLELSQIRHEWYPLDPALTKKITALMSSYGLEFAALDFVIVDSGEPIFLELNPGGQWLWLQYMTGINLADPFIDFLCS